MMKSLSFVIAALIALAAGTAGHAALIRVEDQAQLVRGGLTLDPQSVESANLRHLREADQTVLGANLIVDVDGTPTTWTGTPAFPTPAPAIAAGTSVNSHLIHFDPVGSPGSASATATFTFDTDVLGVIFSNENLVAEGAVNLLNASDSVVGLANTTYNTTSGRRTLRTSEATDVITISPDRRSVTVTQVVGGANFDELRIITASNGLPIPTLEYNASIAPAGATLNDSVRKIVHNVTATIDWTNTGVTQNPTLGPTGYDALFASYVFNGADSAVITGANSLGANIAGDPTNDSASFEIVFRPDDYAGNEVLFEFGGTGDGSSLTLSGHQLQFVAKNGGLDAMVTRWIASDDFVHAVGVIDLAGDRLSLYVDGFLAAQTTYTGNDWAGGDGEGLGSKGGGGVGGDTGPLSFTGYTSFQGQIALFRFYESALDGQEVQALFQSLHEPIVPEPATAALLLLSFAALRRRRARA